MDAEEDAKERPFLQTIIENPDDDAPRLIFADWLEEHDNGTNGYADRADFIRVQDRLAGAAPEDPQRTDWAMREQVLLDRHRTEWERPLARFGARSVDFRKGFPYGVTITAKDFLKNASFLFAAAPIRSVRLLLDKNDPEKGFRELRSFLQSPHISRLKALNLRGNRIGEAGARILAVSKALRQMHSLNLTGNELYNEGLLAIIGLDCPKLEELNISHNVINRNRDDVFTPRYDGLQRLAESELFRNLRVLDISSNGLYGEGLIALLSGPTAPRLTELNLARTGLESEDVGVLARSDHLRALKTLNLSHNSVGISGARELAESPHLFGLKALRLNSTKIHDEGALTLAASDSLHNLAFLSLRNSRIGRDGAKALAASRNLARLRILDLGNGPHTNTDDTYCERNFVDREGVRALAHSPNLRHLICLNLSENSIDVEGAQALATGRLSELRELNLSANSLGNEGLLALVNSKVLGNLRVLNLSRNGITESGVTALARSASFPDLHSLDLSINGIHDAGARALAESENMRHLVSLNLAVNGIRSDGAKALATSKLFTNLSALRLDSNRIGRSVQELAKSVGFPNLTVLSLKKSNLFDEDISALAHSTTLSRLLELELGSNNIRRPETLVAFMRSEHFPNLTKLGRERTIRDSAMHRQIDELIEQRRIGFRTRSALTSGRLSWSSR